MQKQCFCGSLNWSWYLSIATLPLLNSYRSRGYFHNKLQLENNYRIISSANLWLVLVLTFHTDININLNHNESQISLALIMTMRILFFCHPVHIFKMLMSDWLRKPQVLSHRPTALYILRGCHSHVKLFCSSPSFLSLQVLFVQFDWPSSFSAARHFECCWRSPSGPGSSHWHTLLCLPIVFECMRGQWQDIEDNFPFLWDWEKFLYLLRKSQLV